MQVIPETRRAHYIYVFIPSLKAPKSFWIIENISEI